MSSVSLAISNSSGVWLRDMTSISKTIWASLVVIGAVLPAVKGEDIKRLSTVNTLFDADRIVDNFSNMDRAFLTHDLDVPIRNDWTVEAAVIPATVDIAGTERNLEEVLDKLDTTALVIVRNGKIIHERYYRGTGPDDRRISWSVAKFYMLGPYGKALADGAIRSLENEITTYCLS